VFLENEPKNICDFLGLGETEATGYAGHYKFVIYCFGIPKTKKFGMMDRVRKPNNSEYYVPSSETFGIHL
jgi:hypothetical protein